MKLIRTLYRAQSFFYPCCLLQTDSLDVRPWRRCFIEWTPWLQATLPCVTFTLVYLLTIHQQINVYILMMKWVSVETRMLAIARQGSQTNGPRLVKFRHMKMNFLLRISDRLSDVRLGVLKFFWIIVDMCGIYDSLLHYDGAHGGAVRWGTTLQIGMSRVWFPMVSSEFFHFYNPSGRTMALGLTQPPTEMITRNISWGKSGRCLGLTTLTPSCADCLEIWEP